MYVLILNLHTQTLTACLEHSKWSISHGLSVLQVMFASQGKNKSE